MANILLAEDDTALREFLKAALENNGHTVDDAEDGAKAFALLQGQSRYDLLLSDIVMPNMDGLELSKQAKKLFPDLKIMFISGFAGLASEQHDADKTIKVISKPFHLKDIVAQVNKILTNTPLPNAPQDSKTCLDE